MRTVIGERCFLLAGRTVDIKAVALARALVGGKELELILLDGTTKVAAELVLFEFRARGSDRVEEERVGVQGVIAEVLPGRAVILRWCRPW